MKWEYRVALFRWRSDVWQEVNNMTDELNGLDTRDGKWLV